MSFLRVLAICNCFLLDMFVLCFSLFFVSIFSSVSGFNEAFYMILFYLLSWYIIYTSFFKNFFSGCPKVYRASQVALVVKNLPANTGDIRDMGSIPGLWRFPGGGHGNPRQYSYLENPMDRGTLWAKVHRVTKSWTRLKRFRTRLKRFSTRTLNRY